MDVQAGKRTRLDPQLFELSDVPRLPDLGDSMVPDVGRVANEGLYAIPCGT